ncbi:hypothetical protein EJB05_11927, partial [Eragrostis curvula]
MAAPIPPIRRHLESPELPRQLPALIDNLMEEIFVRITCPADLTRTSAACVTYRLLIADPTFLRRYRTRHPPLLLGFFSSEGYHPVEAPHPNAPAARALADMSFDYLPTGKSHHWSIRDVRDGRVLIQYRADDDDTLLPVAVCDPLSGQYQILPPIPHHEDHDYYNFDATFAPCAEANDETSFRVMGTVCGETEFVVLIFDSGSVSWTVSASASWEALSLIDESQPTEYPFLQRPFCVYGSLYWEVDEMHKLLKLDIDRMEFSTINLPFGHDKCHNVLVEAGEGRLGMFSRTVDRKSLNFYYYYNSMENEHQGGNEWEVKNVIPLPVHGSWAFYAQQGYTFLRGDRKVRDLVYTCYSLDIDTLKLETAIQLSSRYFRIYPYFGFPPSMTPKKI